VPTHSRVNPLPQGFSFTFYIYQLVKAYFYCIYYA